MASGLVIAAALVGAGSAAADEAPQHQGGATAVLDGLKTYDRAVLHTDGKKQELAAGLFEMTVDGGGKLKTYCIDIHNPTQDQAKYLETPGTRRRSAPTRTRAGSAGSCSTPTRRSTTSRRSPNRPAPGR